MITVAIADMTDHTIVVSLSLYFKYKYNERVSKAIGSSAANSQIIRPIIIEKVRSAANIMVQACIREAKSIKSITTERKRKAFWERSSLLDKLD